MAFNQEDHKYLCWLNQVKYLGRINIFKILQAAGERTLFSGEEDLYLQEGAASDAARLSGQDRDRMIRTAKRIYEASEADIRFWCGEAFSLKKTAETAAGQLMAAKKQEAERIEENLARAGIGFSCILEEGFPQRLREIPDPPFGLYYRGRLPSEEGRAPAVAVIGARLASGYGREQARRFSNRLALRGVTIISGMARGIDGIAQKAALDAGGESFAVLGCGVDLCYPEENRGLYDRLLQEGGVLSEYVPGTVPEPKNFPPRNRIISGLSDLVLVIEARKRSGTLITVDMALEQGREVFALPGRVSDALSDGCNRLIRQGAGAATCPGDILEYFYTDTAAGEMSGGTADGGSKEDCQTEDSEKGCADGRAVSPAETDPGKENAAGGESEKGRYPGGEGPFRRRGSLQSDRRTEGTCQDGETGQPQDRERRRRQTGRKAGGSSGCHSAGESSGQTAPPQIEVSSLEKAVLQILSPEDEMHLEEILEACRNRPGIRAGISEVSGALLRLKIDGRIEEAAAGYYRRTSGD